MDIEDVLMKIGWKGILALGISICLIALGVGGCCLLVSKGAMLEKSTVEKN
jgi:hypothetical protein